MPSQGSFLSTTTPHPQHKAAVEDPLRTGSNVAKVDGVIPEIDALLTPSTPSSPPTATDAVDAGALETRVQKPTVSTAGPSGVDDGQGITTHDLSTGRAVGERVGSHAEAAPEGGPNTSQVHPAGVTDAPPLTPKSTSTTTASRPIAPGPTSPTSPTSPGTSPLAPALPRSLRSVERDITHLSLTPTPTPKQMSDHLKRFNALLAEAVDLGRPVDDLCRAEWFLDSLPLDFEYLRLHYDTLPSGEQGWGALKGLFQGEVRARQRRADREARFVSEGEVLKRGVDALPKSLRQKAADGVGTK
ncbi:hypothetical protein IAT38_006742 [Cryptococcus sp. DSM 104549]